MFSETPCFTGLQGFETARFVGGNIYFCAYLKCNERLILCKLIFHSCFVEDFALRRQGKKEHGAEIGAKEVFTEPRGLGQRCHRESVDTATCVK